MGLLKKFLKVKSIRSLLTSIQPKTCEEGVILIEEIYLLQGMDLGSERLDLSVDRPLSSQKPQLT